MTWTRRRQVQDSGAQREVTPAVAHLLFRVRELANQDWTDAEAVPELLRFAGGVRPTMEAALTQLQTTLAVDPWGDLQGLRMSRIMRRALAQPG